MIIGENFFITEFEKTGTTFLRNYFRNYKNVKITAHHDFINYKNQNLELLKKRYRITTVRNPFSWYVSLWKWSCKNNRISPLYKNLTKSRIKISRLKFKLLTINYLIRQLLKNKKKWENLFIDPNSTDNFNIWIKEFLNTDNKLEIGSDYSYTVGNDIGYMTYQFLIRNSINSNLNALYSRLEYNKNTISELLNKNFINYVIKTENLNTSLIEILPKLNLKSFDLTATNRIEADNKDYEYLDFISLENKNLIYKKEFFLFKNYYPEFKF